MLILAPGISIGIVVVVGSIRGVQIRVVVAAALIAVIVIVTTNITIHASYSTVVISVVAIVVGIVALSYNFRSFQIADGFYFGAPKDRANPIPSIRCSGCESDARQGDG